jgi:hypothetical protein
MDWNAILSQVIYPALYGLLLILLSVVLKVLVTWLKAQAAKTSNELLRQIALSAASEIEQRATTAAKLGEDKWGNEKKKLEATDLALKSVKSAGLKVDEVAIDRMIESVLGESKL